MGANLFFPGTGATLELTAAPFDEALLAAWQARVGRARAALGWEETGWAARRHAGGVSLSIAAPVDQLFLATEVNEWALCASLQERDPARWPDLEDALLIAAFGGVGRAGPLCPARHARGAAGAAGPAGRSRSARTALCAR